MLYVEIWMGGSCVYEIKAKKIDASIDGNFVKITDLDGLEIETSPHNVIIVHPKEKGGAE
jgi:hypothetical protein